MDLLSKLHVQFARAACILLLCTFYVVSAVAQTSRGTVTGLVTDPSGAAVANASVDLINQQTNIRRDTQTNPSGFYRFDAVDPGEYAMTVKMAGFSTATQRAIPVLAGQTHAIDVRLEVGETSTVVEVVEAAGAVLQVESPVRGANITTAQATELPLPLGGRDPVLLALTLPGVASNRFGFGVGTFPVNGSRGRANNFLIDGVDNNDAGVAGQAFRIRNPDAVREVSVQTSNYDAEFGRAGGAVVNTIVKSGTNELHGSLFYILDSTFDDAITNTQSLSDAVKARGRPLPGTEQWYGVTAGGPLIRNRTFLFGAWHDQKQRSQSTVNLTVPTAAGWATLDQAFPKGVNRMVDLYREATSRVTAPADAQPTIIPLGGGRPSLDFATLIRNYTQKQDERQWLFKIDHQISMKNQLSGRYVMLTSETPTYTASFPGFDIANTADIKNVVVTDTHVFAPSVTNELRVPFSRLFYDFPIVGSDLAKSMPRYSINGVSAIGAATTYPQDRVANNYALQDTLNWIRGTHSLRFGVDLVGQRGKDTAPARVRGEITYNAGTAASGYPSGFGNFVDDYGGINGGTARDIGSPVNYPRTFRQAYFFQDRWRATSDFTLTLGLRYDYFGVPMNALRYASFSGLFNVDPVTLDGPYRQPSQVSPDRNNWAPTVGVAWSPSAESGLLGRLLGNKRTVIRSGYQIGYDMFFNNILSNAATSTPNIIATTFTSTAQDGPRGTAGISSLLPTTAREPLPIDGQTLVPKNLVAPYQQRWSFGIQRELPANVLLDVSYVGSKGTRLFVNEDLNPLVPASMRRQYDSSQVNAKVRNQLQQRLDPLQGGRLTRTNGGDSNYHSLQTFVNRRFASGFGLTASYTWSKLIDNASEVFGVANNNNPQNTAIPSLFGGLRIDRAVSFFDRPHRAVFTYLYEFPFMKQQRGVIARVVGGWQLAGVTTLEAGPPLNVYNGPDADGLGSNWDRPDINPDGKAGIRAQPVPLTQSSTGYVNPDVIGPDGKCCISVPIDPRDARYIGLPAFAGNVPLRTGNAARNTERMPATNNWDAILTKRIAVTERIRTELRWEVFNVFNHPQYAQASISPFSPGSGSISADVGRSLPGRFLKREIADGGGRVMRYQLTIRF